MTGSVTRLSITVFALLALLAPLAPHAAGSRVFSDPAGDVTCCTRDVTGVRVANNDAGTITFDARFLDTFEDGDDDDLSLLIDADREATSGDRGFDYRITAHVMPDAVDSVSLGRWEGRGFVERHSARVHVSVHGLHIRISFDRHLLGDTDSFDFRLELWEVTSFGGAHAEFAPDSGTWSFPVRIALGRIHPRLQLTPSRPSAGRDVVARLALHVAATRALLASGRVSCVASVGGRRLTSLIYGFIARRAVCAWHLPSWAKGKTLSGAIAVLVDHRARSAKRVRFVERVLR